MNFRLSDSNLRPLLVSGGWLMMEIGHDQSDQVRALLQNQDGDQLWNAVELIPDLQSIPRVALARKR